MASTAPTGFDAPKSRRPGHLSCCGLGPRRVLGLGVAVLQAILLVGVAVWSWSTPLLPTPEERLEAVQPRREVATDKVFWVAESSNRTDISQTRWLHLQEQGERHHFTLHLLRPSEKTDNSAANSLLIEKLAAAESSCPPEPDAVALVTQDDVHLHSRFFDELHDTLHALPPSWRSLHLCPGYLSSQPMAKARFRPVVMPGPYKPKGPVPNTTHQRFFQGLSPLIWLGRPLAFVVNCSRIANLRQSVALVNKSFEHHPAESTLVQVGTKDDFIARDPQLCVEWPPLGKVQASAMKQRHHAVPHAPSHAQGQAQPQLPQASPQPQPHAPPPPHAPPFAPPHPPPHAPAHTPRHPLHNGYHAAPRANGPPHQHDGGPQVRGAPPGIVHRKSHASCPKCQQRLRQQHAASHGKSA